MPKPALNREGLGGINNTKSCGWGRRCDQSVKGLDRPCLATGDRISCDDCDRIPKGRFVMVCKIRWMGRPMSDYLSGVWSHERLHEPLRQKGTIAATLLVETIPSPNSQMVDQEEKGSVTGMAI